MIKGPVESEGRLAKPYTRQRGQTSVEFALLFLTLIIVVLGIVEFGRLLQAWLTVQNSAQAGSRFAITGRCYSTTDQWDTARLACIKSEARKAATSLSINDDATLSEPGFFAVTVRASDPPEPTPGAEYPGGPNVRVAVSIIYNHELITPIVREIAPWVRLQARSEMITERFRHPGLDSTPGVLPQVIPVVIAGQVRDDEEDLATGITNVTVEVVEDASVVDSVSTDTDGYYIVEVRPGWSGTIRPQTGPCTFNPSERSYTSLTSDMPSEDYITVGSCP